MPRPRTPIGTFGEIHIDMAPNGQYRAFARFRDHDGRLRRVQSTASTPRAAERKLKELLAERTDHAAGSELTRNSSFRHLVDLWLDDLDIEARVAENTRELYERNMRKLVMPTFEHLTLREITVGRVDRFLKSLASIKSYSTAKQAKTVLSLALISTGHRRCDGAPFELAGLVTLTARNGKIINTRDYMDLLGLQHQLNTPATTH